MVNRAKSKRKKLSVTEGTKQNLNTIINELSFIISRKKLPDKDQTKTITDAFSNIDSYISAIGLILPEIDEEWRLSGSRDCFLKIKKKRQFRIRLLISLAVIISICVIGGTIAAVIFIDFWLKWAIFIVAVLFLLLTSSSFSKYIMSPIVNKYDQTVHEKFTNECQIIDNFVKELINLRRKL